MGVNKRFIFICVLALLVFSMLAIASEPIIELQLDISKNDNVKEHLIRLTKGIPTQYYTDEKGDYALKGLDESGNEVYSQSFYISFEYRGAVVPGVDYSGWGSDRVFAYYKVPYSPDMYELRLYHDDNIIYSKILDFCNNNGICDISETYETCPEDCPLDHNDKICMGDKDGLCDPDCAEDVDPDCENEFFPYAGENKEVDICEEILFHGEVKNAGDGEYTYSWFFEDDGTTAAGQDVTHFFDEYHVFAADLTVTNQEGISKTDTLLVYINEDSPKTCFKFWKNFKHILNFAWILILMFRYFLLIPLFTIFSVTIFIYWMLHRKEENSLSYVIEGVYGCLITLVHIIISIITSFFLYLSVRSLSLPGAVLIWFGTSIILPVWGIITEYKFYKNTNSMRWKYALIFSTILIIIICIIIVLISLVSSLPRMRY